MVEIPPSARGINIEHLRSLFQPHKIAHCLPILPTSGIGDCRLFDINPAFPQRHNPPAAIRGNAIVDLIPR